MRDTAVGEDPILLDERLFAAFVALNALGFDEEYRDEGMHPVRLAVRAELAQLPTGALAPIAAYQAEHPASWFAHSQYALMVEPPPGFALPAACQDTWAAGCLPGYGAVLAAFYGGAGVAALWRKHLPAYDADGAALRPLVQHSLEATWEYLRAPLEIRHRNLRLVPNLLGPHHCATVFAHPVTGTVHVVRGPYVGERLIDLNVVHELLHTVVDPVVDEAVHGMVGGDELVQTVRHLPTIRDNYHGDLVNVVEESLVRAVTKRVARDAFSADEAERSTSKEYRQGFLLIRYFLERLASEYEPGHRPLVTALPEWVARVDVTAERARWAREVDAGGRDGSARECQGISATRH